LAYKQLHTVQLRARPSDAISGTLHWVVAQSSEDKQAALDILQDYIDKLQAALDEERADG
jgi:maltose-binding protein MalE